MIHGTNGITAPLMIDTLFGAEVQVWTKTLAYRHSLDFYISFFGAIKEATEFKCTKGLIKLDFFHTTLQLDVKFQVEAHGNGYEIQISPLQKEAKQMFQSLEVQNMCHIAFNRHFGSENSYSTKIEG